MFFSTAFVKKPKKPSGFFKNPKKPIIILIIKIKIILSLIVIISPKAGAFAAAINRLA